MSTKSIANAVGGKTARACDSCVRKRARWYCAADDAFLCQSCDSAVHSANPLARRHQRLRLNSASSKPPNSSAPSWLSGFTRKPRTPRPRPKSDDLLSLLSNPSFSLVPEADEATSLDDNEEDHLLYRVPTFDPFLHQNQSKSVADSANLHGFLPSDLDLADFAADVETLLGRNLESECFDMEALGLGLDNNTSAAKRVKLEDHHEQEESNCRAQQQFEAELDLMREPFELNFDDYDHEEKVSVVGVKNEREEDCVIEEDESKTTKKRRVTLRLDCDAVISAWGNDKSPWTTGERPDFEPDESWPHCMAICGVSYGHTCGEYGVTGAAAMGDGGREARVSRYREKRRTRLFSKKIRYEVRKLNAEKRPRMKGRFVKRTPFQQPTLPIISIK